MFAIDQRDMSEMIMDFAVLNLSEYVKYLGQGNRNPYICNFGMTGFRNDESKTAKKFAQCVSDNSAVTGLNVIYVCRSLQELSAKQEFFDGNPLVKVVLGALIEDDPSVFDNVSVDNAVIIMDNAAIDVNYVLEVVNRRGYGIPPMILMLGENW